VAPNKAMNWNGILFLFLFNFSIDLGCGFGVSIIILIVAFLYERMGAISYIVHFGQHCSNVSETMFINF